MELTFMKRDGNNLMSYRDALEFIGEVRGGISWERFCMQAIRNFDAFIDFLNDTKEAREFLAKRSIERQYVVENLNNILDRVYFNPGNDHYLTLGLRQNATRDQVHNRWKRLMVLYHPDRNRDSGGHSARCASRINEAYSVLKDSEKRMEYDRKTMRKRPVPAHPRGTAHRTTVHRQSAGMRKQHVISSGMRRVLARVVLPVLILLSIIILLMIFLENRYALVGRP
jgi:DnaJ-domain-containing protein 1